MFVFVGRTTQQTLITAISGFGFFVQKPPFCDGQLVFAKIGLLKPRFLIVFLGAQCLGQVVKKGKFGPPQKQKND